ncbi:MAG: 2,3-bisphosphoglycerate-independent phosphoglycerate mutase [Oscillospiraceae bacterium]|nr:2,3-bisphosphoglycerate-independent phosphoglycerate mutase [Oscillospiraceae bacterium]
MKYLLVIGDGMADNPVPELGNKTPLEVANKPVIDDLSRRGVLGSVVNCPKQFEPGSATAIMSIFGASPLRYYHGRGPLEAAAQDVKLADGDMACRCNMITLEDADVPYEQRRILSHSAGSIEGDVSDQLITELWASPEFSALAEKYRVSINPGSSFRHFAVMSGADITGMKLIPPHDHLGEVIGPLAPSGCEAAKALEELQEAAFRFLGHHPLNEARRAAGKMPANAIWFWAEGTAAVLPDFQKKYGHTGEVVSAVPLVQGIAKLSGLSAPVVPGVTGEIDTNWEGKCEKTIEILSRCDFAALHIEAPDECTHNGDTPGKLQSIEWLDSREVSPILNWLQNCGEDYRILILSDHKTLTSNRAHDGDPVPFLIYDSREPKCSGLSYTEVNGLKTGINLPDGTVLLNMLFEK